MESSGISDTPERWLVDHDVPQQENPVARLCQIYVFPLILNFATILETLFYISKIFFIFLTFYFRLLSLT